MGGLGLGLLSQDARRDFSLACRNWYPVIRELHRFFIAISRAVVNDDGNGGTPRSIGLVFWGHDLKNERPWIQCVIWQWFRVLLG